MSYKDEVVYPKGTIFTPEQLSSIRPEHFVAFLNMAAYGTPNPGPEDRPTNARDSTLINYKRHISYYMPINDMHWNQLTSQGNPTRCRIVNAVIASVAKHQVRKEGKASKAVRAFTILEFKQLLLQVDLVRRSPADPFRFRAILLTQWQLIARIDDVQNLVASDFCHKSDFPDFIFAKMKWSKNMREERDSGTQILLPAMDEELCVYIALGSHMETFF